MHQVQNRQHALGPTLSNITTSLCVRGVGAIAWLTCVHPSTISQVGLIFQQFAPFLKMYTAYTDSSEEAMNVRT